MVRDVKLVSIMITLQLTWQNDNNKLDLPWQQIVRDVRLVNVMETLMLCWHGNKWLEM